MFNCVSAVLCPVLYFHFFLPFSSCCTVRYCTVLVQCSTLICILDIWHSDIFLYSSQNFFFGFFYFFYTFSYLFLFYFLLLSRSFNTMQFFTMNSFTMHFYTLILSSIFIHSTSANIVQMINQLKCASGRSRYEFYDLSNYGCWCGVGGSGKPLDRIDRCCWAHDKCFEQARTQDFKCNPKKVLYSWTCEDKNGICENEVFDHSSDKVKCAKTACDCDKVFSKCVSEGRMNRRFYKISKGEVGICKARSAIRNFMEGLYYEVVEDRK